MHHTESETTIDWHKSYHGKGLCVASERAAVADLQEWNQILVIDYWRCTDCTNRLQ
jgi:hypothetical protein